MREIAQGLWIGHAGDLADRKRIAEAGVRAVIELALEEAPSVLWRDAIHMRIPIYDGPGNDSESLSLAITCVTDLIVREIPTLVCCSNGMSRSPSITACAMARVSGEDPTIVLARITSDGPADVSPFLWGTLMDIA